MDPVRDAHAIVGAPFTPVSVAGVARRTTRRAVFAASATTAAASASAASAPPPPSQPAPAPTQQPAEQSASAVPIGTVVQSLPGGCTSIVVNNASYSDCAGAYYKAAFQGNSLVYVVVPKP
jgi:hypothetical protein